MKTKQAHIAHRKLIPCGNDSCPNLMNKPLGKLSKIVVIKDNTRGD